MSLSAQCVGMSARHRILVGRRFLIELLVKPQFEILLPKIWSNFFFRSHVKRHHGHKEVKLAMSRFHDKLSQLYWLRP